MSWRTFAVFGIVLVFATGGFFFFRRSDTVEWQGNIIGVLVGGEGLAIRRDTGELFQAYMPVGVVASVSDGIVRIRGRLNGTSCAYANTVFAGTCVSVVDVESINQQ